MTGGRELLVHAIIAAIIAVALIMIVNPPLALGLCAIAAVLAVLIIYMVVFWRSGR